MTFWQDLFSTTGQTVFFLEPLPEHCNTQIDLCFAVQLPPPPSCCRLCHSPRCQLTPLAPPAPILRRLCFLSAGIFLLCCCLLLSTGAFTSASCRASTSRHNSATCRAPLVLLVVAFPSASASLSCRASARRLGLRHLLRLNLLPCPSRLVGCRVAQCLNPHLNATPPGASATASC